MLRARAGTAALAVLTATASGCALFEQEEEDLDFAQYESQLTDMFNESVRLTEEMDAAEARIIQACLEEDGFTVHDPAEFESWGPVERESFVEEPPYDMFLPTAADAELRGFWQWTTLDGAESFEDGELYAAYEEDLNERIGETFGGLLMDEEGELDPFYLLAPEDQFAWYVAYGGEAWAAENHPDLGGAGRETDENGEEVYVNPTPEGCLLEMIEAVYGGLETSENDEEGWIDWTFRPDPPNGDWSAMNERYADRVSGAEPDYLDCLSDRGHDGWEFANGQLWVHSYLSEAGEGEHPLSSFEDGKQTWPNPPEDVPAADDVEGWLAFERALAVDFAECGDESGFRDAAEHAWQQAQLRYYLDIEEETFAWQEEMRGYLEKAQEVIGT